jgi:hypothetical protein
MKESNVRRKLGVELRRLGFHVSQIESHATSAGIPDTHYFGHNTDGFIELKVAKVNGAIEIRNTQKAWFRERIKAGGHHQYVLVGIHVSDTPSYALIRVKESNMDSVLSEKLTWNVALLNATTIWAGSIDYVELARIITEEKIEWKTR